MNKNIVSAVARRDLRSWFGNPTGYVFIVLFVVISVVALLWSPEFFRQNLANLDTLNTWFPFMAIVFAAAITMGTWTTERSSGTQELLFTLPARDSELLLGKYIAALGVYTVSLVFTLTLPIGLSFLGTPDWGQLLTNYLGFWLFGGMLIAQTMIGSQFSDNLTVSLLLGILVAVIVTYSGTAISLLGGGSAWVQNGPIGQFSEFARGMVSTGGLLCFVGLTVAFLQLNLALLSRRHYRQGQQEGAHRGARFAALAVGAIALTVIGVNALPRMDTTLERIHSLGSESRALLAALDKDRPVTITAFVSAEVPQDLVPQRRTLLNLIDQFDRIGGSAVQQRVVITEPFTDEARDAQNNYGISPRMAQVDAGGTSTTASVFLGFVVQSGTEEVVTGFVEPGMPLEYELTRSIRVVSNAARKTIGVLKTDVELYGGFDFQTFQQKPRWQMVDELLLQYKVENVDADQDYPQKLDALVVPQPSSLGQAQMDRLKTWILDGHPTLLLEDPAPLSAPGTAATDEKGGPAAQLRGQPRSQKGDIQGFFAALGLLVSTDQVVWDLSFKTFPEIEPTPEFVFLGRDGFGDDIVTRGLDRAVALMSGRVQPQAKEGWTFTPLLHSPKPDLTRPVNMNGLIPKLSIFIPDWFGGGSGQPDPRRRHQAKPDDYVLAARVTGKAAEGKTQAPKLIVVADLDMVGNTFFSIRRAVNRPGWRFDNVPFVLNCIDSLVGDESLIELRKRRPILRSLTRVEDAQTEFETRWLDEKQKAENAADEALKSAQARLDESVAKVRDNKDLDEQAKEIQIQTMQTNEQRKLEISKAKIEDDKQTQIERARHVRDTQRLRLYNSYRWVMLGLTPLPALVMGLVTFVRRRQREAAIVPQNRLVK